MILTNAGRQAHHRAKRLDLAAEIERLKGMVAALEKRLERLEAGTPGVPCLGDLNDFERAQKESQTAERAEPKRRGPNRRPAPPDTPEQREIERREAQPGSFVKQRERKLRILDAALVAVRQAALEQKESTRGWPDGEATGVPLPPHITPSLSPDDIPREVTEVSEVASRARPPSGPIPADDTVDIKLIALRWSGGK
jgi:hypothetical protein